MNNGSGGITEVLSGNKAIKLEVGVDTTSMLILGLTILVAVTLAVLIGKKI